MTDQTATATMTVQFVELRVAGQPDVENKYGSGHIRPTVVSFRYRAGGVRAQVHGRWVRDGGELTTEPCSQEYAAHTGDMTGWPEWLAALAREQAPADRSAVLREAADAAEQTFIHGITPAASERDEIWDQAVRAVATMLRGQAGETSVATPAP